VIEIDGTLATSPRRLVVERLSNLPQRPRDVIIERWLPYSQPKRRVIHQRSQSVAALVPRNLIIEWEAPEVQITHKCKDLGTVDANPEDYVRQFGHELKCGNEIPVCKCEEPKAEPPPPPPPLKAPEPVRWRCCEQQARPAPPVLAAEPAPRQPCCNDCWSQSQRFPNQYYTPSARAPAAAATSSSGVESHSSYQYQAPAPQLLTASTANNNAARAPAYGFNPQPASGRTIDNGNFILEGDVDALAYVPAAELERLGLGGQFRNRASNSNNNNNNNNNNSQNNLADRVTTF
jgi:hypothetical protein